METVFIYPTRSTKIIMRNLLSAQGTFIEDGTTWRFSNVFENLEVGEYEVSVKDSRELVDTVQGIKVPEPTFEYVSAQLFTGTIDTIELSGEIEEVSLSAVITDAALAGVVAVTDLTDVLTTEDLTGSI